MTSHPRMQNISVLLVLCLIYIVPAVLLPNDAMLDVVSAPLLIFGVYSIALVAQETAQTFWEGQKNRAALALYGLFCIFLSVIATRSYGLVSRNFTGTGFLDDTHVYSAAIYIQLIGLYIFTKGAASPSVEAKKSSWPQLIAGVIIGAIIASSRFLETILMVCGKLVNKLF